LALTFVFGVLFLANQAWNWSSLVAANMTAKVNLYGFTFYLLTGLHAAHVIGGLIPLGIVALRARAGRYSPAAYGGVEYTRMYWHFLGGVWIAMFVLLLVTT
jgi:cytochrome c oxidase subunit 3